VCAVFIKVWCGFGGYDFVLCLEEYGVVRGVSVCCLWENYVWFCGIECELCGKVCSGFMGVCARCLLESLLLVWGSEFELCVGEFVVGVWE